MKMKTKLMAALLMVVVSSAALAADKGVYVSADLGQASYAGPSQTGTALRIGGGFNIAEIKKMTIGVEGAYARFGSVNTAIFNAAYSTKTSGIMANAVVAYDIPNVKGFGVFGKLGMMSASTKWSVPGRSGTSTSTGMFIGAGVKYSITNEWEVRGQYEDFGNAVNVNGVSSSLSMFSAGAVYNF